MAFFTSGYGDFTGPCALSPLPPCYVTNTTYTGCLVNPQAAIQIQQAGVGTVVLSALVLMETTFFSAYLGYQQAWIGRRERSVMYFLIALATLFQTVIYGGAGYGTVAIGVVSSMFIGFMNAAYTSLIAVGIIGYDWVPEGGLRAMMISIAPSGIMFLVSMMVSLTSSLGWTTVPATPHYSPSIFFLFFIWPLICMAAFVGLQLYVLFRLYLSWKTVCSLVGAFLLYGASFVLIFPYNTLVCQSTSQAVNGVFFGVFLQGCAYALLFLYFRLTAQDGWDTTMVVFDDVMPTGNSSLPADTRNRQGAHGVGAGGPIPPPKDDVVMGGYYGHSGRTLGGPAADIDHRSSYYDDPHI